MSTEFVTLNGIEIEVEVTYYSPARPMLITGSGFGDCLPPEPEEIEFVARYPDGTEVEDNYILDLIRCELP